MSSAPITNLWVDDGSGNLVPVTTSSAVTYSQLPDDVMKFYEDAGVDGIAREAGLIEDEEVVHTTITTIPASTPANKTIKLIAVPVQTTSKLQTVKVENGAPRPICISGNQNIGSTPIVLTGASGNIIHAGGGPVVAPKVIQIVTAPQSSLGGNSSLMHGTSQSWSSSILQRKRPNDLFDSVSSDNKRRKGEKSGGKGLRHFSMKVCEKVQKKGITTYNEVADELVSELSDLQSGITDIMGQQFDQKNIRRRVYDALNVLMAMNIISKEKKEIRWIGLPTNTAQECQGLEAERNKRKDRIRQKTQQLQELILQQIAFRNLVERNRRSELQNGPPDSGSIIRLPFIVVNTSKSTVIDCSISDDKSEYLFNFDRTFEIHDDIEVLKRMGLAYGLEKGQCNPTDLQRAIRMVPRALEPYVAEMANGASSSKPVIVKSELDIDESDLYLDQDVDSEVAMVTGNSPESSFDSYSDHQSSTHHDFSDDSESNI